MATHRLEASPETVHWGFFDAKLPPQLTIDSGDTVTISTVSGTLGYLPKPDSGLTVPPALQAIHDKVQAKLGGPHILTGPVAVRGAKAGQVLEVRIKAVELYPGLGLQHHPAARRRACRTISRRCGRSTSRSTSSG